MLDYQVASQMTAASVFWTRSYLGTHGALAIETHSLWAQAGQLGSGQRPPGLAVMKHPYICVGTPSGIPDGGQLVVLCSGHHREPMERWPGPYTGQTRAGRLPSQSGQVSWQSCSTHRHMYDWQVVRQMGGRLCG
jgi:hypothetical protein